MSTDNNKKTNDSVLGFFRYFYDILGNHIFLFVFLNVVVGILDGFGLALFIPLLSVATGTDSGSESLGKLEFLTELVPKLGLELNLVTVLGLMVVIFSIKGLLFYAKTIYYHKLRLKSIRTIRYRLIDGLRNLKYKAYTNMDAGKIQNNMVAETGRLVQAMTNYFNTIQNVVILLTYVALAFAANWQFALLVALGGLLSNIVYRWINKITKREAVSLSRIGHGFNKYLIEAINHFKYLKATEYFRRYEKNLKQKISQFENTSYKIGKLNAIAQSIREPLIILVISIVILVQINFLNGEFGSMLVGLMFFYRALSYLVNMQNTWNLFISNGAGLISVDALLTEFKEHKEADQRQDSIIEIGEICLQDISVQYGEAQILKDINLSIPQKSTIALVGESGAGKTTLANVICGLIEPSSGSIYLKGNNTLHPEQIYSYRRKFGYISQEPVIFNDTIYNNVTFWSPKSANNVERFNQVMELVSLKELIQGLPLKEEAPLGNNGILISGGQKQRISIARELYKEVEVLIMDEATSALDSETEKLIKENIEKLQGRYTMVIIAHRLSTIKNANQIYLMDKGEIVNQGDYFDLCKKSDTFNKMVKLQMV